MAIRYRRVAHMLGKSAAHEQTNKQTKYMKNIIAIAAFAAFTIVAQAANPSNWAPPDYSKNLVTSKAQAEDCCKADAKVALVCKDCKTTNEKAGTDKEGILGWFKAESMHDCAGCKGKITTQETASGKGQRTVTTKHECSKCGKDSAYTCSTHAKNAK